METDVLSGHTFCPISLICRFIDLRSVPSLSDAECTTEDALQRELLVNWDELFTIKPAG